jgi:hypothetical protein
MGVPSPAQRLPLHERHQCTVRLNSALTRPFHDSAGHRVAHIVGQSVRPLFHPFNELRPQTSPAPAASSSPAGSIYA